MYADHGAFLADWIDHTGKRRRQAHRTEAAARRAERKLKALAKLQRVADEVLRAVHHKRRGPASEAVQLLLNELRKA